MQSKPIKFLKKDDYSTYDLIRSKVVDYSEIVVNFFDYCNMKCSFCPQDHSSIEGMTREEILSKVPFIINYIQNTESNEILLHLMGGELFQDELIDRGFLQYYTEFIHLLESQKPKNKKLTYNFITNLVFTRIVEVKSFCNKHDLKIAISYDPVARFTKKQLLQFKANVEVFKSYIRIVSCVMTKQNMSAIIRGDEYFTYLYNNFDCHWDHLLVGDSLLDIMMPKQSEVYEFYRHLVDNYPKTLNMLQFVEKTIKTNKMGCTRGNSFTILSDNSIPKGCSGSVILKDATTEDIGSTKIIDNFIQQNDCLSCEYYSRCNLTCFVNNDYKKIVKDIEGCVYKKVFEYADAKSYN
jgi:sulfatase maturation enzyme AslB (radical SAM superfamily)